MDGSLWDPFLATIALVRDDFRSPGSAVPRFGLYNNMEEKGWGTIIYAPSFEHCTGPPLPYGAGTCALYRRRVRLLRGGPPPPPPHTQSFSRNHQLYFEPGCIPHPFFHASSLPSLSLSSAAVRGAGPLRPSPRSVRRHRSPPTAYELEPARHRGERLSHGVRLSPVHPRDGVPDTAPECLLPLEPLRRCVRPRARVLSMSILCTAAHCQREGKCVEQPSSKYLLTPTGASGARAPAERAAGGETAGGRSDAVQFTGSFL